MTPDPFSQVGKTCSQPAKTYRFSDSAAFTKKIYHPFSVILCLLVVYILVGQLLHRYVFPEPVPNDTMYPVSGDVITNPFAGEQIIFLKSGIETSGAYSLREFHLKPGGAVPSAHIHSDYHETFKVIQGKLTLICNGSEHVLGPGDSMTIPRGTAHQPVNKGSVELVTINKVSPAARHDLMLAQTHGFFTEKAQARSKIEFFLQAMLFVDYYKTYRADIPIRAQKILSFILAPTARLLGYRTWKPQYSKKWKKPI
ncbi:cupin domain-containing protein [Rhodocytophaga rosea]|uniref:Cupin domain-containing protein n=1 Tax=Rhodocytophaga rosea TaxID=2704465 RepID=A0A6C0GSS0_9BACT|nr:cupin domain-containing protein [Rhodocytophaga rosea]QHT70844.1 cupin domain-containing protein [Rhodocytophaga rosea]